MAMTTPALPLTRCAEGATVTGSALRKARGAGLRAGRGPSLRVLTLLLACSLALVGGCRADADRPAASGDGAGADEAGPSRTSPRMARIAARGVMGHYTGTLTAGEERIENHEVDVLTDRNDAPMVTVREFCSIQFTGDGPDYVSEPGQHCLVALDGDPRQPHPVTGTAHIANGRMRLTVTFTEVDIVWNFEGAR